MLKYPDLVDLERTLNGRTVLSAYVNGAEPDLAKRKRWRVDLRHSLNDIEKWLEGASHADREAFAACRRLLLERLDLMRGSIRSPGWAGFFTTDGEVYAGPVPASVPTMAVWSTGACLTPYVRALKEARAVLVAIVDGRTARIFRYVERKVELLETLRAKAVLDHPDHMSAPPRQGFHGGTRGATGADVAQRELREGTAHMISEVATRLARYDGTSWVVLGGIPSVAAELLARLPATLAEHAARAEHLDIHASKAEVVEAVRQTASILRDARDLQLVEDAITGAVSNGLGVTGSVDTKHALEQGRAREVYFTQRFFENHAAAAEDIVRLALGSRAYVEQVSGAGAQRLDGEGGIAARLRYALAPEPSGSPTPAATATG